MPELAEQQSLFPELAATETTINPAAVQQEATETETETVSIEQETGEAMSNQTDAIEPASSDPDYIDPIDAQQQQQVIERTAHFIRLAGEFYNKKFQAIDVLFDLSGATSGMYRVSGKQRWIRYNPYIFARYFEDNLQTTVPHEVAHYVTDCLFGLKSIRPHGREWKSVMQMFGVKPDVTGNYDLQGIPQRKQKRFDYYCDCMQHQLSSVRHHRVMYKQAKYFCKVCKQALKPSVTQKNTIDKG